MLDSVEKLYTAFDSVFPRPISFDNEGCCVSHEDEQLLLELPRHQWTEEMLAMPMDSSGCFGTFEEVSYLVPRLMELLADSEEGFLCGILDISFYGFLLRHEEDYRALGVWETVENVIDEILWNRTADFAVQHYDLEACRSKDWGLEYFDLAVGTDMVDGMLGEFFYRKALNHLPSTGLGSSEWDEFFERWARDGNANRIAYLLDTVRLHYEGRLHEFGVPASFIRKLQEGLAGQLVDRAWPVISAVDSPTWLRDLLLSLEINVGYKRDDTDD